MILIKKPVSKLNEIFQSVDVKFSMLRQEGDVFTQVSVPAKCRDFLGDMLWSRHYKTPFYIYGMGYDWNQEQFDVDYLKLSITFPEERVKQNFLSNIPVFLHNKEKEAGIDFLTIIMGTDDPLSLIVIASPHWMGVTWKLSLYTYYLKVCCYEDVTKLNEPEDEYAPCLEGGVEQTLLQNVKDSFVFFDERMDINHNRSGFVSVITDPYKNNVFHAKMFKGKK